MMSLFAESLWEAVVASSVIGLGVGIISMGIMGLFPKRPPSAVGEEPPAAKPRGLAGMSKPVAFLLMAVGLAMAVAGFFWRTSLPL